MNVLVAIKNRELIRYREILLSDHIMHLTSLPSISSLLDYALSGLYDALVIDLCFLQDGSLELVNHLRQNRCLIPIIIMSLPNRVTTSQIIHLLDTGCDDVIRHPMDVFEFLARIRAHILRQYGLRQAIIRIGNIRVDLQRHQIFVNNAQVTFTNKEQSILESLAIHKGRVLSKEMLLSKVYSGINEPEIRTIDAFVSRIRRKLHEAGQGSEHLQTVWGRGYRLSERTPLSPL